MGLKLSSSAIERYFSYLDGLRESGVTNMWGAAQFLESQFEIDHPEASEILCSWMKTFSLDQTLTERVQLSELKL